jgi:hypothetical protein
MLCRRHLSLPWLHPRAQTVANYNALDPSPGRLLLTSGQASAFEMGGGGKVNAALA